MLSFLVPDAESHFTLPVMECLSRIRGRTAVHLISADPEARARHSRHRASFEVIADDAAARIETTSRRIDAAGIDIVLPVSEIGIRMLQAHRNVLEGRVGMPPIPSPHEMEVAGDKWRLAEFLFDYGIPHPPTLLYTGDAGFGRALDRLPFPVLIKPRVGSGGHGIRAFDDRATLLVHLDRNPDTVGRMIVQSQVAGQDVDYSVLCRRGEILAQTAQRALLPPPRRFAPSTAVEMLDLPEVGAMVRRVCAALEWDGIANMDLRQDEDGKVVMIEINPRYWSSLLASLAVGVNFPHLSCLAGAGIPFRVPEPRSQIFLQPKIALESVWRGLARVELAAIPRPHETAWPYVVSDPVPHLAGWFGRPRGRAVPASTPDDVDVAEAA